MDGPSVLTVSDEDAIANVAALIDGVAERGDEVIVERDDRPTAVIIPFAAYQEATELRRRNELRRGEALTRVRAVRGRVRGRHQDLTAEKADALTFCAVHEVMDDLARERVVRFERDRRS